MSLAVKLLLVAQIPVCASNFHVNVVVTSPAIKETGNFTVLVHPDWAPRGAQRFAELVTVKFFDEARFFRVISGFMAQFGIAAEPSKSYFWRQKQILDDPVRVSNRRGRLTFATGGKNTRTTQIFINFKDNSFLDKQGFSPFGEVVQGMEVVDKLYAGYGEGAPQGEGPPQGKIGAEGNEFLKKDFPLLSYINTIEFLGGEPPEGTIDLEAEAQTVGIPAMVLLVILTFTSPVFGRACANTALEDPKGPRSRVIIISTVIMCVSLCYWVWAAVITLMRHFDLGIASFAVTFWAGFLARYGAIELRPCVVCWQRLLLPLACLVVTATYGYAIHTAPMQRTLVLYYWIGAIWWVLAAFCSLSLGGGLRREANIRTARKYDDVDVIGAEDGPGDMDALT